MSRKRQVQRWRWQQTGGWGVTAQRLGTWQTELRSSGCVSERTAPAMLLRTGDADVFS